MEEFHNCWSPDRCKSTIHSQTYGHISQVFSSSDKKIFLQIQTVQVINIVGGVKLPQLPNKQSSSKVLVAVNPSATRIINASYQFTLEGSGNDEFIIFPPTSTVSNPGFGWLWLSALKSSDFFGGFQLFSCLLGHTYVKMTFLVFVSMKLLVIWERFKWAICIGFQFLLWENFRYKACKLKSLYSYFRSQNFF